MMRSLFSGVSGLKNHQTRMDVIGNNIANVNTTGYKSSRVTFTDTLQQTLSGASAPTDNVGGTNPKQIGLGSAVGSIDMIMTDGSVQSTGKNTDLCLSGNGFFIVNGPNGTFYTRDGAFEFDKEGNYVLPGSGLYVQGWTADASGAINTQTAIGKITIPAGKSMEATATKTVNYSNNLDSAGATIESITRDGAATDPAEASPEHPVTLKMSDGTVYTMTTGTYKTKQSLPVATTISVYDSLGNMHNIPVYFTKTEVNTDLSTGVKGNKWSVTLNPDAGAASPSDTAIIKEADGSTTTITMPAVTLEFDSNGKFVSGNGLPTLTLTNGATTGQSVQVNLTGLTQYSGSNTIANSADGNEMGTLKSIAIDSAGVITGTYTNGINRQEGQVAIAQFTNSAGLTKTGSSLYSISNNSGEANVKTATDLGVTITPSALEMSNVDIANEFSDMIITQRGFQSNSKIITVSDEMLETLVNMKR